MFVYDAKNPAAPVPVLEISLKEPEISTEKRPVVARYKKGNRYLFNTKKT
jgi:hypothetical protein